ncbi:hypothetical protein EJB05_24203, partial [Eragrostis curvula]
MEWWSSELLVVLAGLLPNPKLETAVVSICLHTITVAIMVPIGLSAAISTRVSNELGARRPVAARLATWVAVFLVFSVCIPEGLVIVLARNLLGYMYSNNEEVATYTARVMPVVAVAILFDGLQSVLSASSIPSFIYCSSTSSQHDLLGQESKIGSLKLARKYLILKARFVGKSGQPNN